MSIGKKKRFEVFKRDKFTCQYCGQRPQDVMLEVDHVVPKVEGGSDDMANLTTACFACNRGKAGNPLTDVAPQLDELQVLESIQEMMERQHNMKAQIETEQGFSEAVEQAHELLHARWLEEFHWDPSFPFDVVRSFLRELDVSEVCEALDIAISWRSRTSGKNAYDTSSYFVGILKHKANEKKERASE